MSNHATRRYFFLQKKSVIGIGHVYAYATAYGNNIEDHFISVKFRSINPDIGEGKFRYEVADKGRVKLKRESRVAFYNLNSLKTVALLLC